MRKLRYIVASNNTKHFPRKLIIIRKRFHISREKISTKIEEIRRVLFINTNKAWGETGRKNCVDYADVATFAVPPYKFTRHL